MEKTNNAKVLRYIVDASVDGWRSSARNERAYQPVLRNSGKRNGKLSSLLSFSGSHRNISIIFINHTSKHLPFVRKWKI